MDWLTENKIPLGKWIKSFVDFLLDHGAWFFDLLSEILKFQIEGLTELMLAVPALLLVAIFAGFAFWLHRSWKLVALVVLVLDWSGHNRLTLTPDGSPGEATVENQPAPITAYADDMDLDALDYGTTCCAPPDIRMRTAIEIRHRTGRPVLFLEQGKLVGVIGDDEIYEGLLRQSSPNTG